MTTARLRIALLATALALLVLGVATPSSATDPTPKWCDGVKIAAFAGGWPPGTSDRYANIVTNGFRQAELDLGPTVKYYFSRWVPDQLATDLEQAIDSKPDGIVFVGLLTDAAAGPLIDKAFAQGTIVTTTIVDLPQAQKKYASQGMGYVGARTRDAGLALGGETAKRAEIKAGDSVFVGATADRAAPTA
jgi:simple sugar transport system substrate-binding protein